MQIKRDYYRCEICGNIVEMIEDSGVEIICCGEPMTLLDANTTDAATEKHVPVCKREGNKLRVDVGSVPHPMIDKHYIQWIAIAQENHTQRIALKPGQEPSAEFSVNDGPVVVYEYCNLHGLWKAEVD